VASIRLETVRKVYDGEVTAVHDINFQVEEKEFVVLGSSGYGKTTTLHMIAEQEEVTAGNILLVSVPPTGFEPVFQA
jgi:multiple sugar transport system ATP-binding protein